jgi:hypothetical protein
MILTSAVYSWNEMDKRLNLSVIIKKILKK